MLSDCITQIAILNLEGASIIGLNGAASRFFGAMAAADVNIIMITQASSEHSICVAVPEEQGDRALKALERAFELELVRSTINSVSLLKGMSVVAIVGEGMAFTPGVSATFMKGLAAGGVNIRAIAQGSSERQVCDCTFVSERRLSSGCEGHSLGGAAVGCEILCGRSGIVAEAHACGCAREGGDDMLLARPPPSSWCLVLCAMRLCTDARVVGRHGARNALPSLCGGRSPLCLCTVACIDGCLGARYSNQCVHGAFFL